MSMESTNKALREELRAHGYVRCPNNIYSMPGQFWYAGGPGLPEPSGLNDEIYVHEDKVSILRHRFVGVPYVKGHYEHDTVAEFNSAAELAEWCKVNGRISLPGLPAFSNSWD